MKDEGAADGVSAALLHSSSFILSLRLVVVNFSSHESAKIPAKLSVFGLAATARV
jgi:hypothetical protein